MNSKYLKKISCVVLIVLTLIQISVSANEPEMNAKANNPYYDYASSLLLDLGIVSTDFLKPNEPVTRAELATIACKTMGIFDDVSADASAYIDVSEYHWAADAIATVSAMGVMRGYPTGEFRPEELVTYAQAVKVMVAAAGYDWLAIEKGGYPYGYSLVAADKGITDTISCSLDTAVSRGIMTVLVFNTLDVDCPDVYWSNKEANYTVERGKTLLSVKHNVQKKKGVITANGYTGLTADSTLRDTEIEIDYERYNASEKALNIRDYLGYYVTAYIKDYKNEDTRSVISFLIDEKRNHTIKVPADGITSVSQTVFEYTDENKSQVEKARISPVIDVIFNGKAYHTTDRADLRPASGYVTLLDNNSDDVFEAAFVESYDTYFVKSVDFINDGIRLADANSDRTLVLDTSNIKTIRVIKDKEEIALTGIKQNDVVTVLQSMDHQLLNIFVSDKTITGKLTEKNTDYYIIDGTKYKIDTAFNARLLDDFNAVRSFYLDIDGRIAGVDVTADYSRNYGYLLWAAASTNNLDKTSAQFKIYTTEGKIKILDSAKNMVLNNDINRYTGKTILESSIFKDRTTGYFIPQLIVYELNSDNEIYKIKTATYNAGISTDENVFTHNANLSEKFEPQRRIMGGKYIFNDKTLIFCIPQTPLGTQINDEDVAIAPVSSLTNSTYNMKIYDASIVKVAKVAVLQVVSGSASAVATNVFLVDKISRKVKEDGSETKVLYGITGGYNNSSKVYFEAKKPQVLDGLQQGDIVQISATPTGEVDYVKKIFSVNPPAVRDSTVLYMDSPGMIFHAGNTFNAETIALYGVVHSKEGNVINVSYDNGITADPHPVTLDKKIYVYNKGTAKISLGTMADIVPSSTQALDGSKVFMLLKYCEVRDLVIIKD